MTDERTELEKELIQFLRQIEVDELKPRQWGIAPHKANKKLEELEERGIIDEGGRRYDEDGNRITWEELIRDRVGDSNAE